MRQDNRHCAYLDDAILSVSGQDASHFLQGQLTQDMGLISAKQAAWAAYCTVQGRMLANFCLLQRATEPTEYLLCLPQALVGTVQNTLNKYAVFSQVKIQEVTAHWVQLAVVDADHSTEILALSVEQSADQGLCVYLSEHRILHLLPVQQADHLIKQLYPDKTVSKSMHHWRYQALLDGVARIENETSALWIPQQLKLDALGGIGFRKGCYLGQEIIARLQYRGRLKRTLCRAMVIHWPAQTAALPGTTITSNDQSNKAVGQVVNAELKDGHLLLLAVINNTALSETLQLASCHLSSLEPNQPIASTCVPHHE